VADQPSLVAPPALTTALTPLFHRRRVALAVSGGPDSTALLCLAAGLASQLPAPPVVLTVDHGLRPAAAAECAAVAARAADLGLSAEILTWTGAKPATGIQAAARAARYALLADAARRHGCDALVTAHTLDDQAETFLLALARGSGVYGLAAMRAARDLGDGLVLLRPLLATPKADLVAWLDAAGIAYVRDPSNADPRYARARLRAAAPNLAALGLTPRRLADTARGLARAAAALDGAADAIIATATPFGGACRLPVGLLIEAPEEIGLRALARLVMRIGGAPYPPRFDHLERLHAALRDARGNLKRTLAGSVALATADGALWIAPEAGRAGFPVLPLGLGETADWDHRTRIALTAAREPVVIAALGPQGARRVRAADARAAAVPAAIVATLPALWRDGALLQVPDLDLSLAPDAAIAATVRRERLFDAADGQPEGDEAASVEG
jgi:tRNA(Ile)-lysidine synthase